MADQVGYCSRERLQVIQSLALQSRKLKAVPPSNPANDALFTRLEKLFDLLEGLEITPKFKEQTKIDAGLKLIYDNEGFFFPDPFKARAKALYEKWEHMQWGAPFVQRPAEAEQGVQSSSGDDDNSSAPHRVRTARRDYADPGRIRLPPSEHPIWGENGIMRGLAIKRRDGTDSTVFDSRYPKRNPKVFGHNGLEIGQWFPRRLSAVLQGAHGHSQAGIAGNGDSGAYSIVVSGSYDDLDQDRGETLYYSGSNSHDNTDPNRPAPATTGTQALHTSLATGTPVRVIRTDRCIGRIRPVCGLRYDGLYEVVAVRQPLNGKGGRYEQFELVRVDDQGPLEILKARPTLSEQRDFAKIADGFKPHR